MALERSFYIDKRQDDAYALYQDGVIFEKDVERVYDEIDYKIKLPDFLGKTVKVTKKQFTQIYRIIGKLSSDLDIECPAVYVYEDYYYGAESYGISNYWIELSAKTIQDFSERELCFLIAREIYKIADGVTKQKTMMEEHFKMIRRVAPDEAEEISRLSFYHWYRLANFSADNYGYLMCGSMKTAVWTILKLVLNSVMLAEQVDIKEFIGQASDINRLDDTAYNYTKADESAPYAPHRIQNLMAYALSDRGMKARKEF